MAFISGGHNRFHDRWVIQLLRLIDLSPSRNAPCVIMRDVRMEFFDRLDDIPFHDLHVINIVEEFEPIRSHGFAKFCAPRSVITLVILVIHFAVEQFHHHVDPMLLGCRSDLFKADGTVFETFLIAESSAISRKTNQI